MANTQFNGFKFIRSQNLSIEEIVANCTEMYPGMMCFVRTSQNGHKLGSNEVGLDGYIVFNGKAYATGNELSKQIADINTAITNITKADGTINTRIGTAISELNATVSGSSTDNYVTVQVEQADGKLSNITVTDAGLVTKLGEIATQIANITDNNGTIDTRITNAINALDSKIQITGNTYINPTIVQENGKLTSITLDETALKNKIDGLDAKIDGLNATVSGSSKNDYVTVKVEQANGVLTGVTVTSNVNEEALAIPTGNTTSNKLGLVTAGQVENFVKTSVADLAGAMHFAGTTTGIPTKADGDKAGDVRIDTTSNKEYIFDGKNWLELGDESHYVTKATTIAGVDLQDNISKDELLTALNVANGAQVNVIEQVNVNGAKLTPTDKTVNVTITEGTANGTIKVNGTNVAVHGLGSAAYTDSTKYDASGTAERMITGISGSTVSMPSANYGIEVTTTQSAGKVTGITVDDSALKNAITGITNDISTLDTNVVKSVNGQTGNTITLTGENIAVGANVDGDGQMASGSTVSTVLSDIYTKISALSSAAYTGITSTGKTLTISGEGTTQNVEVNLKANVDPGLIQLMKDETTGAIYGAMYYDGNEGYTTPE